MKLPVLIFAVFLSVSSFAQDTLQLFIKPGKIKIGEPTELRLQLHYKADDGAKYIEWPELSDTIIKNIEILDEDSVRTKPDKTGGTGALIQEKIIKVTSFDSGYYALPPMTVIINEDTLYSNPVLLEVHTVAVDTTKEIKHIKGIYETELSWGDFFVSLKNWFQENIIWIIAVLVVIIGLIIYFIYKRRKKPVESAPIVIRPPHEVALEKLQELETKKLWQNGFMKEYYIELTEILRSYIEARFRIHAMEQTTDEIMSQLRLTDISEISKLTLVPVLRLSDLVKFAKENPIGAENEEMMQRSKDFIISTIQKPNIQNSEDGL